MASKTAPDLSTLSPTPGNDLWNNVVIRSSICDLLDTSTLTRLARLDRSTFASSVRYFWSGETESFGTDERLDKVKDAVSSSTDHQILHVGWVQEMTE